MLLQILGMATLGYLCFNIIFISFYLSISVIFYSDEYSVCQTGEFPFSAQVSISISLVVTALLAAVLKIGKIPKAIRNKIAMFYVVLTQVLLIAMIILCAV